MIFKYSLTYCCEASILRTFNVKRTKKSNLNIKFLMLPLILPRYSLINKKLQIYEKKINFR